MLNKRGLSINSVVEIQKGMLDEEILNYARKNKLIIITFDKDFGELVFKEKLSTYGIILLRIELKTITSLADLLYKLLSEKEFNPIKKFIVVKEERIRTISLKTN